MRLDLYCNQGFQPGASLLKTGEIYLQECCWIGAKTAIAPGVVVGRGAILTLGSTAVSSLDPMMIYTGNPARAVKARKICQP